MILARLLYGKKIELVIDGTIVDIANVNRARTQKIRRVRGKVWWAKRRRKIVRRDYGKVVEFEEVKYGMLMMVLCDREGGVYDVWITFGSVHEVRAFRERKKRSLWFRWLAGNRTTFFKSFILCLFRASIKVIESISSSQNSILKSWSSISDGTISTAFPFTEKVALRMA